MKELIDNLILMLGSFAAFAAFLPLVLALGIWYQNTHGIPNQWNGISDAEAQEYARKKKKKANKKPIV